MTAKAVTAKAVTAKAVTAKAVTAKAVTAKAVTAKAVTAKAPPKTQSSKRSRLEVVEGGLADSDADAIHFRPDASE